MNGEGQGIDIKLDSASKSKFEEDIKVLKEQLENIDIQIAVGKQSDKQKAIQKLFGIADKDVVGGFTKDVGTSMSKFMEDYRSQLDALGKYASITGMTDINKTTSMYNSLKTVFTNMVNSGQFAQEELDLVAINLRSLEDEIKNSKKSFNIGDMIFEAVAGSTGELGQIAEIIKGIITENLKGIGSQNGDENAVTESGGNWISLVIGLLVNALMNVSKDFENFDKVISPVTYWFENLKGLLQGLFNLLEGVIDIVDAILVALKPLFDFIGGILSGIGGVLKMILALITPLLGGIRWILNLLQPLTDALNEFFDNISEGIESFLEMFGIQHEVNEEKQKEIDKLKELNKQYQSLSQAIDEQEQYYLKKRTELNAGTYNENINRVNDMILTPQGTFSTHPKDTIIAMKHPEELGSKSMILQPIINDYGGNNVEVRQETNEKGMTQLIVNISKKIAGDVANGTNGWDNALMVREQRLNGRGYSR